MSEEVTRKGLNLSGISSGVPITPPLSCSPIQMVLVLRGELLTASAISSFSARARARSLACRCHKTMASPTSATATTPAMSVKTHFGQNPCLAPTPRGAPHFRQMVWFDIMPLRSPSLLDRIIQLFPGTARAPACGVARLRATQKRASSAKPLPDQVALATDQRGRRSAHARHVCSPCNRNCPNLVNRKSRRKGTTYFQKTESWRARSPRVLLDAPRVQPFCVPPLAEVSEPADAFAPRVNSVFGLISSYSPCPHYAPRTAHRFRNFSSTSSGPATVWATSSRISCW